MLRPCAANGLLFSLIISGRSCRILRVQVPPVYPSVYLDLYRYRSFIGVDIYSSSVLISIPTVSFSLSFPFLPVPRCAVPCVARRSPMSLERYRPSFVVLRTPSSSSFSSFLFDDTIRLSNLHQDNRSSLRLSLERSPA